MERNTLSFGKPVAEKMFSELWCTMTFIIDEISHEFVRVVGNLFFEPVRGVFTFFSQPEGIKKLRGRGIALAVKDHNKEKIHRGYPAVETGRSER